MNAKDRKYRFMRIADMGCCVCLRSGLGATPCEIHHLLTGRTPNRRNSDDQTIGLCPYHHRQGGHTQAIHAGKESWEQVHGSELELLEWTNNRIFAGRITTNKGGQLLKRISL